MQKRLLALVFLFAFTQINAQKKEWTSLFDGKTTNGWHTYGKDAVGEAWKVVDGTLMLDPSNKQGRFINGTH